MPRPSSRVSIAREQYKFSCAHMTVFPDGTKERLHGHNYTLAIALEVTDVSLQAMIPFAAIKGALGALCAEWKEHFLLAGKNAHLEILRDDTQVEFRLCGEAYAMPRADVLVLPIDNISVEALAAHAADRLHAMLTLPPTVIVLEITVEESPGQGASFRIER